MVLPPPPLPVRNSVVTEINNDPASLSSAIQYMLSLHDLIGGIFLLAAMPGAQKTRLTQEALVAQVAAGQPTRLLWVVKETLAADSLGADAAKRFAAKGLAAQVVKGLAHFKGRGKTAQYEAQFTWSSGPEVKVISHRHLSAMLCAPETSLLGGCFKQATTVVIDEDPTDSLILPGNGWKLSSLAKLTRPGRIVQALLALPETKDWRKEVPSTKTNRKVITHRWTNVDFWECLHAQLGVLSTSDLDDFRNDLLRTTRRTGGNEDIEGTLSPGAVAHIVEAFGHDYVHPDLSSQRFNLKWKDEQNGTFNANVMAPWPRLANAIVLDAYADQQHYEQLYDASVVLLRGTQDRPLQLQSAPDLLLNDDSIESGQQRQHLLSVLGEILKHHDARGTKVLLLISKKVRKSRAFQTALGEVFVGSAAATEKALPAWLQIQHWQAGRGSNQYVGHDIFALTRPRISEAAREEGLAALAPRDARLRARLFDHKMQSELLQMLHRSRQPHIAVNPPMIVLAWDDPAATAYAYQTPFVKWAHQKVWIDLVSALVQESVARLDGFCFDVLLGTCLIKDGRPDPKLDPQIKGWLAYLPKTTLLRQVLLDGMMPANVVPVGRDTAQRHLVHVAAHLGLRVDEVSAAPYKLGGARQRKVYLTADVSPGKAVWIFEQFVPPAVRTISRPLEDMI